MRKIIEIIPEPNFIIKCTFDNGEIRNLDINSFMDREGKYARKVFDEKVFETVQIGVAGQLYWDGIAEMTSLTGEVIPCEYDICPDFAYLNSKSIVAETLES